MGGSELTYAQWNGIVASIDLLFLLAAQKRTPLYIIHRPYYTPKRLFQFGRRTEAFCPRCRATTGDLIHMLWRCPKLYRYWKGVLGKINSKFGLALQMDPILCILGYLEQNVGSASTRIAILRCLYQARKEITWKWIKPL